MRFTDFLADLVDFGKRDESGNILVKDGMQGTAISRLNVEEIALFSVIDLVASTAAMCEWRTYQNGQYQRGEDWFRWNVEPNQNENAFFFRRLLFARLLRFNEALVFQRADGSLYLADSFSREEFAFKPNKYSGITCNGLTVSSYKTEDEVFYFHLASQDTASLLRRFNSLYSEALAEALDKYKHSGGRSGVLKITGNATKDKNYEENVARLMQNRFKTFFESKNAVIPLFDGYDYTPDSGPASQKLNGEVGDMESLVRQAQDRACNAYHCPPCLLRGDVTNQDEAVQNLLTFGIKPAVLTVENEANRKQYGREILNGWRIRIDMTHVRVVDIFDVAVKLDKLIQDAVVNTNEGRGLLNMDPISEPWADEYHRTKNMEAVNAPVKGGENT